MPIAPFLSGFALSGSLIIAIGAQNAYILKMGLLRHHVFWLCLFCAVSDAALILAGIAGLGALVETHPQMLRIVAMVGGLFLLAYAVIAARRAMNPGALQAAGEVKPTLKRAILVAAAFTWLNPHVYLDTVILIGAFSTKYAETARLAFGIGAALVSLVWFFGLGYGARLLAPLFATSRAWQILDALIAIVMAILSWQLLLVAWHG
jgi:L-lysine exporter family protein LysE/ArgO